jgi:hypothetical protein
VTNGLLITSASGWMQTDLGSLVPALVPSYEENNNLDTKRLYALQWDVSAGTNKLINTGFRDSIDKIGEIALNDEFIFRVKGGVNKNFDANGNAIGFSNLAMFNWYVQQYSFNEKGEIIIDESSTLLSGVAFANSQDGEGYYYS